MNKRPGNPNWGGAQLESKLIDNMLINGVKTMAIHCKKENMYIEENGY